MSDWATIEKRIGFIALFVDDVPETKAFYERVFGLPAGRGPDPADVLANGYAPSTAFVFGDRHIGMIPVRPNPADMIAPAQVASRGAGARFEYSIFVDDVDAVCADLTERGVELINGPADQPWGLRTACFADPSGHLWEIAGSMTHDEPGQAGPGTAAWAEAEKEIGAITLFVPDVARTKSFYQQAFGLPVDREDDDSASFLFGDTVIRLEDIALSAKAIAPAQVAGPEAGARFQHTIFVDDVDAVCAELGQRGVQLNNGPVDRWWGMRTATFADPAGFIWEVAAPIEGS